MKTVLIAIFSGALMLGTAAAQDNTATPPPAASPSEPQASTPAQPQTQTPSAAPSKQTTQTLTPHTNANSVNAPKRIAAGSVIPVSLTKTIDAKKAKTGDEVVAKVTLDMKTNTGEVLVPKDTKVIGHVTEAQAHSKEQKESQVGIVFDRAVMKDGGEMQIPMSIQAIIGPQNNQNNAGAGNGPEPQTGTTPSSRRSGTTGGSQPNPPVPSATGGIPSNGPEATNARPPITEKTEGVVGFSDLKLTTTPPSANEGSVVSSDKNNVKLESGTLMLLRVNQ